jgi:hypothetical protein
MLGPMSPGRRRLSRAWCVASIAVGALGANGCWLVAGLEDRSPADDTIPRADGDVGDGNRNDGGPKSDGAPGEAGEAGTRCAPTAAFTSSRKLTSISSGQAEYSASLSSDEHEIFFSSITDQSDAGIVGLHILRATRTDRSKEFGAPSAVTSIHNSGGETDPNLSRDGSKLYFASVGFPGSPGQSDIAEASRSNGATSFSVSFLVMAASTAAHESTPAISRGEDELYWAADATGTFKIYRARNGKRDGSSGVALTDPTLVADFGAALDKHALHAPVLSDDGLTIFFAAAADESAPQSIMQATRISALGPFSAATAVPSVNIGATQRPAWLSPDDCRLYVVQDRGSGTDLDFYVFERSP